MCTELVPEHMVDLKDELNGHNAALLYQYWPSAKRAKMPFSIMLPGQVSGEGGGEGRGGPVRVWERGGKGKTRIVALRTLEDGLFVVCFICGGGVFAGWEGGGGEGKDPIFFSLLCTLAAEMQCAWFLLLSRRLLDVYR